MSLLVTIRVNNDPPVALVAARRVFGGSEPDSENLYAVQRFACDELGRVHKQVGDAQTVVHRYGDGAAVLAAKALAITTQTSGHPARQEEDSMSEQPTEPTDEATEETPGQTEVNVENAEQVVVNPTETTEDADEDEKTEKTEE